MIRPTFAPDVYTVTVSCMTMSYKESIGVLQAKSMVEAPGYAPTNFLRAGVELRRRYVAYVYTRTIGFAEAYSALSAHARVYPTPQYCQL